MKIGIVGASGNVGRVIVETLLTTHQFKPEQLKLLASPQSAGTNIILADQHFTVNAVDPKAFNDCYLVIFATPASVSRHYIPLALAAGTRVIDSSSHYRLHPEVPLIVPGVNTELITLAQYLYAHTNCIVSPLASVIKPLNDYATILRMNLATYQSVSGAGKAAMDELLQQENNDHTTISNFPRPIHHNLIPQIGKITSTGDSSEEVKIMHELQKIFTPNLKISATAVRVPVFIGHCSALALTCQHSITPAIAKELLAATPGIVVSDDYHTPREIVGRDEVFVGRIRADLSTSNGLLLWVVSDNLRRGAALDAVAMASRLIALDTHAQTYFR